jgi:hypothetical protein
VTLTGSVRKGSTLGQPVLKDQVISVMHKVQIMHEKQIIQ